MTEDTIVALATPPGRGGIGIVRLSGPLAYQIGLKLSQKTQIAARQIVYTSFKDDQGESLDKGIMLFFKAPLSLTGEDIVELQAHGAPVVLDRLVKACLAQGARLAKPGEFLQRAFLNNKIDLAQAEAVADLIQASSVSAARLALRSVEGEFSQAVSELNRKIIQLRTYVEAAIDFPDEEIDFLNDGMVAQKVTHLITQLATLRAQAKQGSIMREGLSVVIAGEPNAGKSTLINCLANKDVAIVTEIPGTTRDVMREHIMMDDLPLFLVDTAGLRESVDVVEQEGIKRALSAIGSADCVLIVTEHVHTLEENAWHALIKQHIAADVPIIFVLNKMDKHAFKSIEDMQCVPISAKYQQNIELLKQHIKQAVGFKPTEGLFLARRRHLQALDEAKSYLKEGLNQLQSHQAGELLAEDLRLAHQSLGEITGVFSSDDLLGQIFSAFCIGK